MHLLGLNGIHDYSIILFRKPPAECKTACIVTGKELRVSCVGIDILGMLRCDAPNNFPA
ncbi:hypothetical protein SDC9_109553 [bioreactor metagenome]|uniref:Uncharacterized protein n=1 Tax=bioreactor metagenome TaxID=1076179 RepID=A0A645BC56_9ZZZZ